MYFRSTVVVLLCFFVSFNKPLYAAERTINTDTTPPSSPIVTVDAGNSLFRAWWTDSLDRESWVVEYQYALGTNPGGIDIINWTSVGVIRSPYTYESTTGGAFTISGPCIEGRFNTGEIFDLNEYATLIQLEEPQCKSSYERITQKGMAKKIKYEPLMTEIELRGINLQFGANYYFSVRSRNIVNLWSPVGISEFKLKDSVPQETDKIAYVSIYPTRDGVPNADYIYTVCVIDSDGLNRIKLSEFQVSNNQRYAYVYKPSWSPDRNKIAFVGYEKNRRSDGTRDIYTVNSDGSSLTRLTNGGYNVSPIWSPDGTKIAFCSARDGNSEVYIMSPDGSNQINLSKNGAFDDGPAWSPDGRSIAFCSNRNATHLEIYTLNIENGQIFRLTRSSGNDMNPVWSPDGNKIAFTSERDGNLEIYVMNADGSNQINLTKHPSDDLQPAWSSDNKKIAFTRKDGGDIWTINADGSDLRNLTKYSGNVMEGGSDIEPAWSPDGSKIAFASDRVFASATKSGNSWNSIYTMNPDGSDQKIISNYEMLREDRVPSWMPNIKPVLPPALDIKIAIEAELADTIKLPMAVGLPKDAEALGGSKPAKPSSGKFIWVPGPPRKSDPIIDKKGFAQFIIDIPQAGKYAIWGRVLAWDTGSDSFWVTWEPADPNENPQQTENNAFLWDLREKAGGEWHWERINRNGIPREWNLPKGQTKLTVWAREAAAMLDCIFITNNLSTNEEDVNPELPDTTAPEIVSGPVVSDITTNSALVSWVTNEVSTSVIEYGTKPEDGFTATGEDNNTEHSVLLKSLLSNMTYYYRVGSADANKNMVYSQRKSFKTLAQVPNPPSIDRTLRITSLEALPGDSTKFQIVAINTPGIASMDAAVKYDSKLLTISGIKSTDLTSSMALISNKEKLGELRISMAGAVGLIASEGALVDVFLTVSAEASLDTKSALSFVNAQVYDELGEIIPVNLEDGTIEVKGRGIKGDVNNDGQVRSNDATLALRIVVGLMEPTAYQKWAADMNNDGEVRANDATLILRKAAGVGAPDKKFIVNGTVTLKLGEVYGLLGQRVTVPIIIEDAYTLGGGNISVSYDSSVLKVINVFSDSGILFAYNVNEPGSVRLAFANASGIGNKILASIEFDVLADEISPLEFEIAELYGADAFPIDSRIIDGGFVSYTMKPEQNMLLQNFPNPFNPETWIPYQLKENSKVTIQIHTVKGELVRELSLGYKAAGFYTSKDRAAYWDGKNEAGELVASGLYFYSIHAGDFTVVRKLTVSR